MAMDPDFEDKFRMVIKKAFHRCIITLDCKHIRPILKHKIQPTSFSGITQPDGHGSGFGWQILNAHEKTFLLIYNNPMLQANLTPF